MHECLAVVIQVPCMSFLVVLDNNPITAEWINKVRVHFAEFQFAAIPIREMKENTNSDDNDEQLNIYDRPRPTKMKKTFQTKYIWPRATKHDTRMLGRCACGRSGSSTLSSRCGNVVAMCLYNTNSCASKNDRGYILCSLMGFSCKSTESIGWSALISTDSSCIKRNLTNMV